MRKSKALTQENFTCEEILTKHERWLNLPEKEAFSNKEKLHREMWCVAQLVKKLGIENCNISARTEPADVILTIDNKLHQIQVAECRNKGRRESPSDLDCTTHDDET